MERDVRCQRCGAEMDYVMKESLQLGQAGVILGLWPNILAGGLEVEIYCCRDCGKIEFFAAAPVESTAENLPQRTCPKCGRAHDFDYPRCPYCKFDYYE